MAALNRSRVKEVNHLCTFCKTKVDINLHAVHDCKWCFDVWKLLLLPKQWNKFFYEKNVAKWADTNLQQGLMEWIGFLFTNKLSTLYGIGGTKYAILKIEKCPPTPFLYMTLCIMLNLLM